MWRLREPVYTQAGARETESRSREVRHVVQRSPDVLDFVVVEVQLLELRQRTKYLWVKMRDEVLPEAKTLQMWPKPLQS